jgi:hypothetical protein
VWPYLVPPLASSPVLSAYGQTSSALPPSRADATMMLLLCLAMRECTLALPPHRAELSPPSLSPCVGPCCPHAMRGYKRGPSHSFFTCPTAASLWYAITAAPPLFFAAPSVPSYLTPPLSPYAGLGAPQGPRAAPRPAQVTSSSPVSPSVGAVPVSFCFLIARPPSYELVLLAMLDRFAVHLGCSW